MEMQLKHTELLATLATDMDNMKRTLSNLDAIKDTLTELKVLNVQGMEFNKRQITSNEEVKTTLSAIDKNLSALNDRVGLIEKTDVQQDLAVRDEKKEVNRVFVERYKANMTFWGVIVSCCVSLISLFVAFALRGGV